MRKKYSDPLMFASRSILMTVPITHSQGSDVPPIDPGDDEWDDNSKKSVFSVNSANVVPASEDPVTIVNPVEEAVNSATTSVTAGVTTESAVEPVTTSPLEVESVIDEIVPEATEESATAATTTMY